MLAILSLSPAALAQSATSRGCGFSLKLPTGWTMTRTPNHDVTCWYALENRRKKSCSILVRTLDTDFPIAARKAGFDRDGSEWVINEPWGETIEAEPLSGTGWKGIQANYVSRETDATTGATTGVEMSVAVLTSETHSAIITSDCRPEQFDSVVGSFRFIPRNDPSQGQ